MASGAVGSLHAGNAVQKADLAYRRPEGGVASLCKPGRNCGAGQGLDGFRRQARASRGFQWRRRALSEVVAEQDLSARAEEHTSELQSLIRNSYAAFCSKKKSKTY